MVDKSEWLDKPKASPAVDRGGVVLNFGKPVKLAQGALEGLWDLVGDSLDMDPATPSVLAKMQAESDRRAALVQDPETSFLGRAAKGAEDIVLGAAQLGSNLVPISNRRAGETPEAVRERTGAESRAMGRAAAEGAVVAPVTTFAALTPGSGVPLETLSADPVGTVLDVLPAVGTAGKLLKKVPGASKVADAAQSGRAAMAATGPGRLLTAAGDTIKSWTSDNLAGTEVPDLPQIVRGAERLGKQAVKEIQEYIPVAGRYPEGHPREGQAIAQPAPFDTVVEVRKGDTKPTITKQPAPLIDPIDLADLPNPELAMPRPADPVSPLLPETQKALDDSARTFATGQDQIALLDKDIRRQVVEGSLPRDSMPQLARTRLEDTLKELGSQPDVGTLRVGGGLVEDFKEAGRRSAGETPRALRDDGTEVPLARDLYPQRGQVEPLARRQQLAGELIEPVQRKVFDDVAAQEAMPWLAVAEDVPLPDLDLPRFIRAKDFDALEAGLKQRVIQAYPDSSGNAPKKIVSPEDQAKATKYLAAIQDYQPVTYRGTDLLAPKRVAVALKVEEAARNGLQPGALQSLQQSMKSSLTSRSLKSGINNLMGNAILQSIRRAGHRGYRFAPRPTAYTPANALKTLPQALAGVAGGPVASELAYWARAGQERAWAKGPRRASDDYTVQKWKALDKEAIYNTNQLDVELRDPGLVDYLSDKIPAGTGLAGRVAKAALGAGQKVTGLLESFYRSGDTWAKAAESSRVFDDLTRMLDRQPEGKTSVLRGRDNARVEVTKLPGGAEYQIKSGRRAAVIDDSSPEFFRLIAGVAAEQADRVFFDYGRTNRLAKKLRAAPIVGIGSPFYSWLSLATDLPGKKGLLSHAVTGPDFVLDRNWTTPADLADSLASNAARDALHGAMVHDIQRGKGEEYLDALAKYPNQYKMMLLADLTNPAYAEVVDLGNWNSFGPTQLAMAGLNAAQGLVRAFGIDPLDLDRKGEGAKLFTLLRKQQLKEGFTGEQVLDLIGLGGSMVLDSISKFDLSSRRGQPEAPLDHLFEIAARTIVGATAADLMTLGLGATQEATGDPLLGNRAAFGKLSETIKRDKDPRVEEAFIKWAIRKFTGAGWQTIATKPQEEKKRWSGIKTAWKASLKIPTIKKELDATLARKDLPPDKRAQYAADRKRMDRWEKIVDEEVAAMRANYFRLKGQVHARSPAPLGPKPVMPDEDDDELDYGDE